MEKFLKRRTRLKARFRNTIWKHDLEHDLEHDWGDDLEHDLGDDFNTIGERVVVFSNAYRFSKILHDVIGTSGGHIS